MVTLLAPDGLRTILLTSYGWALVQQGQRQEGMDQLRESAACADETGAITWGPYELSLLAEVQSIVGESEEAMRSWAEAYGAVRQSGEHYWEAELHRLKGKLLLFRGATPDLPEVEACFNRALEVARRQEAKSRELRAATSLSHLWQRQDKRAEACDLLRPIYRWFSEGQDTLDLKEARAILDESA